MKASRNKLSPRTAGQGVSESSLAGCLHTGRRRHQEKGERKKKNKKNTQIRTELRHICTCYVSSGAISLCALFPSAKQKTLQQRVCTCLTV